MAFSLGDPSTWGQAGHGGYALNNPAAPSHPTPFPAPDPRPFSLAIPATWGKAPGTGTGAGSAPAVPHPAAAPAPAPYTGPVATNYLDSTYENQLNNATFTANQKIDGLTQQQGYANIDLQNALQALAHQQPIDTQRIQESENSRGGFALGREGENIGNLNYNYQQRQSADQLSLQRSTASRDAAIAAVRDGLSTEEIALRIAAADRAAVLAAKNPAIGQSTAPLTPAPSLPGSSAKQKAAPKPAPKAAPKPKSALAWGQGPTALPWGRTSAPTNVPITYGAPAPKKK